MNSKLVRALVLGQVIAVLAFAPAAVAQSSIEGYAGPGGNVQSEIDPGSGSNDGTAVGGETQEATPLASAAPAADDGSDDGSDDGGALAFTGLDLTTLLIAGLFLLVAGIGLRRLAHRTSA